ncbi:MAG: InlB B-repeat-containing protein, partial [Clostridia bacterium]|nr:InlB B-repeat-containing protein [Clostridia bacterium]
MAKRLLALLVAFLMTICAAPTALALGVSEDAEEGSYVLVTDLNDVTTGDYVIYGVRGENTGAMGNTLTGGRLGAVAVTLNGNEIVDPEAAVIWHFEAQEDGTFTVYNAAAAKYLKVAGSNTSGISLTDTAEYNFTVETSTGSENTWFIRTTESNNRVICIFSVDFRTYNPSNNYYDTYLYKYTTGGETPEPTVEPTAEPTVEPTAEPDPTPTPEPVEGEYVLVTDLNDVTSGDYVIYGVNGENTGAMGNTLAGGRLGAVAVTLDGNTVVDPEAAIIWHFEAQEDGTFTVYNAAAGKYLKVAGSNTSGISLTDTAEYGFTVEESTSNSANTWFIRTTESNGRVICIYAVDFRTYNPNSYYYDTYLYKFVEGAVVEPTPEPTAEPAVFTVGTVEGVVPGSSVTVPVTLTGEYEAHVVTVHVGYNSENLTLNSITQGELVTNTTGAFFTPDVTNAGDGVFAVLMTTDGMTGDGVLVDLNFTVSEACTEDQPITLTVNEFSYYPLGGENQPLPSQAVDGLIKIEYTPEPTATPVPFEGTFELVTDIEDITEGDYVLYGVNGDHSGAMTSEYSGGTMLATSVNIVDNTVVDPAAAAVWHFNIDENGVITLYNAESELYCWIGTDSTKGFRTGEAAESGFTAAAAENPGSYYLTTTLETSSRMISIFEGDFRCYNLSNWHDLYLYKYVTGEEPVYHTVNFYDWDGTLLSTQQVEDGAAAVAPEDPVREGYNFLGWDADFSCVTGDLNVTALYEAIPAVEPIPGDVNCDGILTSADISALFAYIMNAGSLTEQGIVNADLNGDGVINTLDVTLLS